MDNKVKTEIVFEDILTEIVLEDNVTKKTDISTSFEKFVNINEIDQQKISTDADVDEINQHKTYIISKKTDIISEETLKNNISLDSSDNVNKKISAIEISKDKSLNKKKISFSTRSISKSSTRSLNLSPNDILYNLPSVLMKKVRAICAIDMW